MKFPLWKRSNVRTTLLGVLALGALIWGAKSQLGVGVNSLLAQLLLLLAALLLVIVLAAVIGLLVNLLRRKKRRD